jgi:hypothetical protein
MGAFRALREQSLGRGGSELSPPVSPGYSATLQDGREEVFIVRLEASRSSKRADEFCCGISHRSRPQGACPAATADLCLFATDGVQQKRIIKYTFEAGICMKTKDRETKRPNKNRLLGLNFRHFYVTDAHFAEKCRF